MTANAAIGFGERRGSPGQGGQIPRPGAGSALTGYGGGLAQKRWLLRHEGVPQYL